MLNVILFYGRHLSCYVIICIIYFYFYFFGGHKAFFKSKCKAQVRPFCIVLEPIFRAQIQQARSQNRPRSEAGSCFSFMLCRGPIQAIHAQLAWPYFQLMLPSSVCLLLCAEPVHITFKQLGLPSCLKSRPAAAGQRSPASSPR